MRPDEPFTIDGVKYALPILPATVGINVLFELGKMLGEPLVKLISDRENRIESLLESEVGALLISTIGEAISRASPSAAQRVIETTLSDLRCDGRKVDFDDHFAGRYAHCLRVFIHALRLNYSDFFDASRSAHGPEQRKAEAMARGRAEAAEALSRA